MDERNYFLGFSVFPGVGPKRFRDMLSFFGSAQKAWEGDAESLSAILGKVYGKNFITFRETFSFDHYLQRLQDKNVWFVTLSDNEYPTLLSQIKNPPFVLYGKGDMSILRGSKTSREVMKTQFSTSSNNMFIGVVGTRRVSTYGRQVTEMITEELVAAGCVIVSGLAMGVDAVAHTVTIQNKGKTIAVLGSGVDVCHPASNLPIYQDIIQSEGAVVSEYPLGESPSKGSFPSRNRIIAGLSHAVVLTEGSEDSGALYTTTDAFANGRKVFAVPGPITSSLSKAPNTLLAQGATVVTSGADVLRGLGVKGDRRDKRVVEIIGDTEEEQKIIAILLNESYGFDEILRKSGYDSSLLGRCLSLMEIKGMVSKNEGVYTLTA